MVMRMRTIIERGEGLALMGWKLVPVNQKAI